MRTLTLHTADELVERWRRRAFELDARAKDQQDEQTIVSLHMAALDRERAQGYRVCAAELLAILAASMEMEAAHHGDPEPPAQCRLCSKWFVPNPRMQNVSCCVMHGPGSCCHYSQTEVDSPADPNALREWLAGERP